MNSYEQRLSFAAYEAARGNTSSSLALPECASAHFRNAAQIAASEEEVIFCLAKAEEMEAEVNTLSQNAEFCASYKTAQQQLLSLMNAWMDAEDEGEEAEEAAEVAYEAFKASFDATFGPKA